LVVSPLRNTYAEVAKQVGVDEKTVRNGLDSDNVPFHV
jgi:predicted transcriptional regulator